MTQHDVGDFVSYIAPRARLRVTVIENNNMSAIGERHSCGRKRARLLAGQVLDWLRTFIFETTQGYELYP
jgi:hypothetical protein